MLSRTALNGEDVGVLVIRSASLSSEYPHNNPTAKIIPRRRLVTLVTLDAANQTYWLPNHHVVIGFHIRNFPFPHCIRKIKR